MNITQLSDVNIKGLVHKQGDFLTCIYSTNGEQIGKQVKVESRNGLSVDITVPDAGFVIFE